MANTETKVELSTLIKNGMYDTSRTARGIPYFVQNGQDETIPNLSLIRGRGLKADGYFIESPDGKFPNGPIWTVDIPGGLGSTRYPQGTLFPNPDKQNFSSPSTLGRQVRRFFDAAVTLIESGDYQYGPNNTLSPTLRLQIKKQAQYLLDNPFSDVHYWADLAKGRGLTDYFPGGERQLEYAVGIIPTVAVKKGNGVELFAEQLDLPTIETEYYFPEGSLTRLVPLLLQVGAVHSSQDRNNRREHNRRITNGGGAGWQEGY